MTSDRESMLPLTVGVFVAVLLHAMCLPILLVGFAMPGQRLIERAPEMDSALPGARQIELGRDRSPTSTVAWLSYEDFRKLVGPEASTEQPAQQQQVDPIDQAPMPLDPTPPAPSSEPAPTRLAATDQPVIILEPTALDRRIPIRLPDPTPDGELDYSWIVDIAQPGALLIVDAPSLDQQAQTGSTPSQSNPTSAPRTQSESPPSQTDPTGSKVHPGQVMTGQGITIATAIPRISAITRVSTWPDNPVVKITFATDGSVIEVELIKSSGAKTIDGPVIASIYKWRATGEKLEELNKPFAITITLVMSR